MLGVRVLPPFPLTDLLRAFAGCAQFDADNDPHGQRDFGELEVVGSDLLWKIDYYDQETRYGTQDPADSAQTTRVARTVATASAGGATERTATASFRPTPCFR